MTAQQGGVGGGKGRNVLLSFCLNFELVGSIVLYLVRVLTFYGIQLDSELKMLHLS